MKNRIKIVNEAMKRGFTLVELLVVVAILGILGTIAISNVTEHLRKANETTAKASVDSIKDAVTTYYINHSKMPTSLDQLIEGTDEKPAILDGGEGALIDPWNNKYDYEYRSGSKRFAIISYGPDGEKGTDDDIRSDKTTKKKQ